MSDVVFSVDTETLTTVFLFAAVVVVQGASGKYIIKDFKGTNHQRSQRQTHY